jgi:phosphoenolpyruvate-protein kinase (PTS system EI component)
MVATLGEVRAARRIVDACLAELEAEGRPLLDRVEIGIMVEIPSAALLAEHIAPEVDFFSIGTNDLTQYTLAVDRANANLSYLTSAFSPAVLNLIGQVIQAGHHHGKWVGVCGELAGEPLAIPILHGLGLDEFSMNPPAVPIAKQIIRRLSLAECQALARSALALENPQQVKELVSQHLPWIKAI